MGPSSSCTRAAAAATDAASVTSSGTTSMCPPDTSWSCSSRRAEIATAPPRQASSRATAAPIPLEAPTTQATLPFSSMPAPAEVTAAEAGLGVREVELPHPPEGLGVPLGLDVRPLVIEALPPQVQGPGVVRPELTPLGDLQGGVGGQGGIDRLQGRDDAAREDVLLDPAEASPGGEDPVVSH